MTIYGYLVALSLIILVIGVASPRTVSKLFANKIGRPKPVIWGLVFGVITIVFTILAGFSMINESRNKAKNTVQVTKTQTKDIADKKDVVSQDKKNTVDTTSQKPTDTPRQQEVIQEAPKENPEETAYRLRFVDTYNAIATAANASQDTNATPESIPLNKQIVIGKRDSFSSASAPQDRNSSYNNLLTAMDTLINSYFPDRGSSVTCSSGGGGSTGQLLLQACLTRRTRANGEFSLFLSQAQQASAYFQQAK